MRKPASLFVREVPQELGAIPEAQFIAPLGTVIFVPGTAETLDDRIVSEDGKHSVYVQKLPTAITADILSLEVPDPTPKDPPKTTLLKNRVAALVGSILG